jgi:hypothetical protein
VIRGNWRDSWQLAILFCKKFGRIVAGSVFASLDRFDWSLLRFFERPLLNLIDRLLRDADQTRNEIIEANQRLVVSNANKFVRSGVPLSDLISEGNTALIKSVELFDAGRGYRLSTYATHAIRRHLSRFVQREQRVS